MATQNNVIVTNCNHHEKPCEKFFNENSKTNVVNYLNTFGIGLPNGHKGLLGLYGNAFSGEEQFVGVGEVKKGDTNWENGNVIHSWASQSKIVTYTIVAKMLEEGLINVEDPIAKYNPDCSGNAYYINGMQTTPDANNPNIDVNKPLTWKASYGQFNLNTITVGTCLQFNIGLPFAIYSVFQTAQTFIYNPIFTNQIVASGLQGQAMLYQLNIYNDLMRKNVPIDVFSDIGKKKFITIKQSVANWLSNAKKNPVIDTTAIPFSYAPNTPTDNLLPFKVRGLMHSYSIGLDILCSALDVIVRNKGYNGLAHYARVKILEPLNMNTTYFAFVEKQNTNLKRIDLAFNRAPVISAKDASGNLTTESYLCDPKYIDDKKSGLTVWSNDYPNDGISAWQLLREMYDPNDLILGSGPVSSTPSDLAKIYKLLIRGGINHENIRVLDQSSVNWLLSPKINSLVNLNGIYPFAQDNDNVTWCGGLARYNNDNNNAPSTLASEYVYYWGGAWGSIGCFDIKSGHYVIISAAELSLGSFPIPYRSVENCLKLLSCALRK